MATAAIEGERLDLASVRSSSRAALAHGQAAGPAAPRTSRVYSTPWTTPSAAAKTP